MAKVMLTNDEWSLIFRLPERINDGSADPEEILEAINILQRVRNAVIMQKIDEAIRGEDGG